MSSPSADVRLNVAASSAEASLARFSAKFNRMMKQAAGATGKVNNKAKQTGTGFNTWSAGIIKSTANMVAMGTAITAVYTTSQLITAELNDAVQLSGRVHRKQETYQQSLKKFSFSNIPATVKDRDGFLANVDKTVKGSGVEDQTSALDIIRTFMSTMVDPKSENRVAAAGEFLANNRHLINANDIETAKSLAAVTALAQNNYATQGSNIQAQVGLMNQANNIAATADPNNFATNIAPTGNKLKALGANQIEALALSASMSTALNDQTGQLVETATANIAGKLKLVESRFGIETKGKTFLERQAFIRSDDPKAVAARKHLLGSFNIINANGDTETLTDEERASLTAAQKNRKLLPKLGGRAKTLFTAMEFFQKEGTADGEGSLNAMFKNAIKELGGVYKAKNQIDVQATYQQAAKRQSTLVANAENNPMFQVANQALDYRTMTESNLQSKERAQTLFAQMTEVDSDYDKFLQSQGVGSTSRMLGRADAMTRPLREKTLLELQQHKLMSEYDQRVGHVSEFSVSKNMPLDFASQARKRNPELFDGSKENTANNNLIEAIEKLNQEIRGLNQNPAKQGNREPRRPAAAGMGK